MANWTVKQVSKWLKENGFKNQVKCFKEKNIDGNALMRLTDEDISQLFIEMNEDGTSQETTIGIKSRFRMKLLEWKININNDEGPGDSLLVIPTDSHQDKCQQDIIPNKSSKKEMDNVKREEMYLVDNQIEIKFFQKSKFLEYFIHFIKQETISIDIEISKMNINNDHESSYAYIIKLTGTKQENQIVRNFIKNLLKSIKTKIYYQKNIQNWLVKSNYINIIQNILDKQSYIFTICQFIQRKLQIYYFDNEKFNSLQNLHIIDNIIQKEIFEENIIWFSNSIHHSIEFIPSKNKHDILSKYPICITEQFIEELENIVKQYSQDDTLVFIYSNLYYTRRIKTKYTIQIFGYKKLIDEILEKLKDLFDKHRLRKFRFKQLSTTELDCIANLCSKDIHTMVYRHYNGQIEIHIEKNEFYASLCLKDEIRNYIKNLLINIKRKTFKNIDFYLNTADKLCSDIKNIAQQNKCYCDIELKTKLKSYPILQGHENTLNISKSIIEQSNLFCSSSLVCFQTKLTNGSIDIIIGDIALQNVDIIIIPSTTFGLKESLIERAGEIIEKQSSIKYNSIPFITETTSGNLNCEKILFVNWSLPITIINDDDLSDSIRLFISKTIEYVLIDSQQSNLQIRSIAFAVPDLCKQEDVLAEEIIEETINQINLAKSISLKISFILLPDQQTLHKQFLNNIQRIQKDEKNFGIFYSPTTTVTITLMCFDDEFLKTSEERISNYLKRSIFKMKLDHFQSWNQSMINTLYKYSIDRCVLPKTNQQQQIILFGPINSVYEVNQKYQLINALIEIKQNFSSNFQTNILINYSPEDSIPSHRLANHLINEGLSISINSDQILEKINQSSCIIFCISKHFFQNQFCEKQIKYADQMGKNIILIKIEYFQPIEWLQKFMEKYSYFQLFGSNNHYNLEYEKLLLKIVLFQFQFIKSIDTSSIEQTSHISLENSIELDFLLTFEQKKLKYEKNIKNMMKIKKGKINDDDKQDLSKKIQDLLQIQENQCQIYISNNQSILPNNSSPDYQQRINELTQIIRFDMGIISYRQWLEKLENLKTILNIPPFTFTGDINDAVFPVLNEALEKPYLLYSLRKHYHTSEISNLRLKKNKSLIIDDILRQKTISTIDNTPKDEPLIDTTLKQKIPSIIDDSSKEEQQIEKENPMIFYPGNNIVTRYKEKKKKPKKKFIQQKHPSSKVSFSTSEKLEFQSKFAEQMQKNIDEFQKFCEDYSESSTKLKIQTYSTAIFGLNPFSVIKSEPCKPSRSCTGIELPLKFPWNSVFDTTPPLVTWTNPSVFFFFSETH